jgi:hypothetical protein
VSLRAAVQIRDGQIEKLELLVRERNERIDALRLRQSKASFGKRLPHSNARSANAGRRRNA